MYRTGQGANQVTINANLEELLNVNISAPTDGQVLTYDSGTSHWVNENPPNAEPLSSVLAVGNSAGGFRITNLADPAAAQDAVTLNYYNTNNNHTLADLDDVVITTPNDGQVLTYDSVTLRWVNEPIPTPGLSAVVGVNSNAAGARINNLANPTSAQDAATKSYVDTLVGGTPTPGLTSVLVANPSASGLQITNLGVPTVSSNAATKSYVDAAVAAVPAPTLAAVLSAGNSAANTKITNLATPTLAADATTKSYVDAAVAAVPAPTLAAVLASGNVAANKITGLSPPTANNDAATKVYVDTLTGILSNNIVPRWNTGSRIFQDSNVSYDSVNTRIGVNTTTPSTGIHLRSAASNGAVYRSDNTVATCDYGPTGLTASTAYTLGTSQINFFASNSDIYWTRFTATTGNGTTTPALTITPPASGSYGYMITCSASVIGDASSTDVTRALRRVGRLKSVNGVTSVGSANVESVANGDAGIASAAINYTNGTGSTVVCELQGASGVNTLKWNGYIEVIVTTK